MIHFCKKILFLSIISTSIFLVLLILSNKYLLTNNLSYQIDSDINTIFLGHSHVECGYNDSIIPQSINLAQSGESYFYTFLKLKYILKSNDHVNQVFVEFTNNQLRQDKDEWTWDKMHISRNFPTLSPICSIQDHYNIFINSPINYIAALQKTITQNIKRLCMKSHSFQIKNLGGFKKSDKMVDETTELPAKHTNLGKYSEINICYLEKITKLCDKHNVQVKFIRSPLYLSDQHLANESLFQEIRKLRFNHVKFIDMKDLITNPKFFRDYGHLNSNGAQLLSEYFSENIQLQ